jgi:hypothetical protein
MRSKVTIKMLRGTTLSGVALNEGDVFETDEGTLNVFKSQGQARELTGEELRELAKAKANQPAK